MNEITIARDENGTLTIWDSSIELELEDGIWQCKLDTADKLNLLEQMQLVFPLIDLHDKDQYEYLHWIFTLDGMDEQVKPGEKLTFRIRAEKVE